MSRLILLICVTVFVGVSTDLLAGGPPGLAKKGKTPPGFSQGKKSGWQDEYPPGWDKKSQKEQDQWKQSVRRGRGNVSKVAEENGLTIEEVIIAADAFEKAMRKGLTFEDAEFLVLDLLKNGLKGESLSASAAKEVDRLLGKEGKPEH